MQYPNPGFNDINPLITKALTRGQHRHFDRGLNHRYIQENPAADSHQDLKGETTRWRFFPAKGVLTRIIRGKNRRISGCLLDLNTGPIFPYFKKKWMFKTVWQHTGQSNHSDTQLSAAHYVMAAGWCAIPVINVCSVGWLTGFVFKNGE